VEVVAAAAAAAAVEAADAAAAADAAEVEGVVEAHQWRRRIPESSRSPYFWKCLLSPQVHILIRQ